MPSLTTVTPTVVMIVLMASPALALTFALVLIATILGSMVGIMLRRLIVLAKPPTVPSLGVIVVRFPTVI